MNAIIDILRLRVIVGFLGEKSQFGWWQSDFHGSTSASFLDPVFPRTSFLAGVEGVSAAAGLLHDDRIGVGRVFHLFRLPEDFEQSFHLSLQEKNVIEELRPILTSDQAAVNFLQAKFGQPQKNAVGPVLVGTVATVATESVTQAIGQYYLAGFRASSPVFPFLKDEQ